MSQPEYLSLAEASALLPDRPHKNTIRRWALRGFKGVKLQSWKLGRKRVTTASAIHRFIEGTTRVQSEDAAITPANMQHVAAEAELDALGVK